MSRWKGSIECDSQLLPLPQLMTTHKTLYSNQDKLCSGRKMFDDI